MIYTILLAGSFFVGFLVWYFFPRGGKKSPWYGRCSIVLGFSVLCLLVYNRILRERPPFLLTSLFTSSWGILLLCLFLAILILGGILKYMQVYFFLDYFVLKEKFTSFFDYYYADTIMELHQWLMSKSDVYKAISANLADSLLIFDEELKKRKIYTFVYIPFGLFNLVLLEAYSGQLYWTWKGLILLLGPQLLIAWCRIHKHVVKMLHGWYGNLWHSINPDSFTWQLVFELPREEVLPLLAKALEETEDSLFEGLTPESYIAQIVLYCQEEITVVMYLQEIREVRGVCYFFTGCHFFFILLCLLMNFFPVIQPSLVQFLENYTIFQAL